MADLDRDLSNRLSRLADAVPTSRGQLDPVHRSVVSARQSVRLAWVTPLVVIVVAALVVGLTKPGPAAPGATAGPVAATDARGAFSLTIRSAKAVYQPDEPIDVTASLAFTGPEASTQISHGLGANEGPLEFGVVEPVDVAGVGLIQLGGGYRLACVTSTMQPGVPIEAPYSKGGSPLLEPPEGPTIEQLQAYMSDRVLRLPAGTWHVYAGAEFSTGDCVPGVADADRYQLRAEITIVVDDDPSATPGLPQPTPFLNKPVYGGDDIGDFTMQLKAGHSTYVAGAPIDIDTWYTFGSGVGNSVIMSHFVPEAAFSITEVGKEDAPFIRNVIYDSACQELTLRDGVEQHVRLTDNNTGQIKATSWPPSTADALRNGVLQLPIGRWRITASVVTYLGPCGAQGESRGLHASIEIDVVAADDPTMASPEPSNAAEADDPVVRHTTEGPYSLEVHSGRGTYSESDAIDVSGVFSYAGDKALNVVGFWPLMFSVDEPVFGISLAPIRTMICTNEVLAARERIEQPFSKGGGVPVGEPDTELKLAYLNDPVFRLPPGVWHIRLSASFGEGTCASPATGGLSLTVVLELVVVPDPTSSINLRTATAPTAICASARGGGRLALDPGSGLGVADASGEVQPVEWPFGYTARRESGVVVLVDSTGQVIGHEGQAIIFGGASPAMARSTPALTFLKSYCYREFRGSFGRSGAYAVGRGH